MRWVHTVRLRLRSLVRRSRVEDELDEELRFHLDQHARALTAQGVSKEDARFAALRAMGGVDQRKEQCRDARRVRLVDNGLQDLRYAARILRRSPGFTAVAILSLALGVGANTAVFQLLDAIRLRNLPVDRPEELMEVRVAGGHGGQGLTNGYNSELTNPLWEEIRSHQEAFSGVFAWGNTGFLVGRGADAHVVSGLWVSGELFPVLRIAPVLGRLFTGADDQRGCGPRSVVISHTFWQSHFHGDDAAIGQQLIVFGRPMEVLGVTPPEFFGLEIGKRFDIALPICSAASWGGVLDQRHIWWLTVMGRLKPGWTKARASQHLHAISPGVFDATVPTGYEPRGSAREMYRKFRLAAVPAGAGVSRLRVNYEASLWLLMGITALVLIIACANLANLMLARASVREREIAVRVAIGASRSRIVAQLTTESLLLAAAGAVLGGSLATILSRGLISFLTTEGDPLQLDITPDWRVFAFSALVALSTCLIFGFVPAIRSSHVDPGAAMKSGARGVTAGSGRVSFQRLLVVAQVAASLVLLAGALLFVRSFRNLLTVDTGLHRDGVVFVEVADLSGPPDHPDRHAAVLATQTRLVEAVRSVAGVESAATSSQFPLNGASWTLGVRMPRLHEELRDSAKFTYVSDGYFKTMGIRLREGRDVSARDTTTAPQVLLVNEAFVRKFFAGEGALGKRVRTIAEPGYPEVVYEVIGVVTDTKYADLRDENPPIAYVPIAQHPNLLALKGIVFRSSGPLRDVIAAVRRAIAASNPNIVMDFQVFETEIRERLVRERVMAWLAAFFGVVAAMLATIGLYGVISYIAARRRNEIGIRLALGSSRAQVVSLMLRDTAMMLLVGLAIGAVVTVAAARAVAVMLFGLSPYDGPTLVASTALLAVIGVLAGAIPAVRASHVDPMTALRCD